MLVQQYFLLLLLLLLLLYLIIESGQTLVKIKHSLDCCTIASNCYCVFSLYCIIIYYYVLHPSCIYIEHGIALKYGLPRDQYKIVQRSVVKKQLEVQRVGEKINQWLMKNKSVFEVEGNVFFKGNLILNSYK